MTTREKLQLGPSTSSRNLKGVIKSRDVIFVMSTLVVLLALELMHSAVWFAVATSVAISAIAAMALSVLVGWAGQPSLLAAASMLVGGVCAAAVPAKVPGSLLWASILSLLVGGAIGAIAALPSRRLSGTYLLLSTMALQFVITDVMDYWQSRTGNTAGYALGQPNLFVFEIRSASLWLWVTGVTLILVYEYFAHIRHSRVGRSLAIIRDDAGAASVAGVNVRKHLTWVFIVTSAVISLAGALDGYYTQNVTYEAFGVLVSISFFVMIVLGGPGSLAGAVLGCAFVVGMPQVLPLLSSSPGQSETLPYIEQLIYGLIGLVVLVARFGTVPIAQRLTRSFRFSRNRNGDASSSRVEVVQASEAAKDVMDASERKLYTLGSNSTLGGEELPADGDPGMVLQLENLWVSYIGAVQAVRGVDLSLPDRGSVAIVGPNGAGKTSVLLSVAGFPIGSGGRISAGHVVYNDGTRHRLINGLSPEDRVRHGIAFVPAEDKVFNELDAREHLRLAMPRSRSTSEAEALKEELFEVFPDVKSILDRRAGLLSGGQRQQLALMCALVRRPRVLVVDELSLGLSPVAIERLVTALQRVKLLGRTSLLLAEQNVSVAFAVADSIAVMAGGQITSSGGPSAEYEEFVRMEFVGSRLPHGTREEGT